MSEYKQMHTAKSLQRAQDFVCVLIDDSFPRRVILTYTQRVFLFTQSGLTFCDPLDCPWNSPGQNTGVGSLSFSRGSSQPRDQT